MDLDGKRELPRTTLEHMNQAQHHRGPDEDGIHLEPGLALGHKRLSIIDLASGQQPLYSVDGNVVIVYNGEIYNFRELREELTELNYAFRTHCDTEVIVYAWQHWGEACVHRFRGMFAFALWDVPKHTLFLARDRLGIKPLHYAFTDDGLALFASELKALLVHPGMKRTIDASAIEDYLAFGYVPEPKTIFGTAHKLPPGHTLTLVRGQPAPAPKQYWDIPFAPQVQATEPALQHELIERLRDAVSVRLVADVPLGAFLSGGVDSSAVVAMMAQAAAEPVNTCSISFGDPAYNETEFADQVAKRYGTAHRVEQVDVDDYDLIDELARIYDEPYADSSAIPTYRVCELARKQVTVALSGDGGDENLAGYRRYRWHVYEEKLRSLIPSAIRRPLFGALGCVYPKADWAPKIFRAKSTLEAVARDSLDGYLHSVGVIPRSVRRELYSPVLRAELQGYDAVEVLRRHARTSPTDHPLSSVQYLDMKTYLAGDILTKVDKASMAHSLEVRVPILDHHLVEWMSGLAPALKLNNREGKYLFKNALEPYLPNDVLYRPKMGFSVPLASWFRGPLRERLRDALLGEQMSDSGWFRREVLERMVSQHQSGLRDHSASLWSLLMFEAFQRNVLEAGQV